MLVNKTIDNGDMVNIKYNWVHDVSHDSQSITGMNTTLSSSDDREANFSLGIRKFPFCYIDANVQNSIASATVFYYYGLPVSSGSFQICIDEICSVPPDSENRVDEAGGSMSGDNSSVSVIQILFG